MNGSGTGVGTGAASRRPLRGIRSEIGTTAIPGAVREEVRIGQSCRPAARHIAKRSSLNWFVVVLAPLVIVNRSGGDSVVAVGIRSTGKLGVRVVRSRIVTVRVPVQALAGPIENSIKCHTWSRSGSELQRP